MSEPTMRTESANAVRDFMLRLAEVLDAPAEDADHWSNELATAIIQVCDETVAYGHAESASPPRVPGPSAQFAKVGVQSGPGQPIDYERGYRAGVEAAALTASAIALAPVGRIRDTATISCYERGEQMRAAIIAAIRALADKPALSDKGD